MSALPTHDGNERFMKRNEFPRNAFLIFIPSIVAAVFP